jgi:hypothetical protein
LKSGISGTGDPKDEFVSDIIQQATAGCSCEPQMASPALNLAGNIRLIEASAQQFISLFQEGMAAPDVKLAAISGDGSNELKDASTQLKRATTNLLKPAGTPEEQQQQLSVIERVVSDSMTKLSVYLDVFVKACERVRDKNVVLREELGKRIIIKPVSGP